MLGRPKGCAGGDLRLGRAMYRSDMTHAFRWIPLIGALSLAAPTPAIAADAFKAECRNVARTTGLFAPIIQQSCEGYPQHRSTCARHISRKGVPNLVRADNFMQCLCDASRQALETDSQDLCHASTAIHGLLDAKMIDIQLAAHQSDEKHTTRVAAALAVERMRERKEETDKAARVVQNDHAQTLARTKSALEKNAKALAQSRAIFEATVNKLRAAEAAARAKLEQLEAKLSSEDKEAKTRLLEREAALTRTLDQGKEIASALAAREQALAQAQQAEQRALALERDSVKAHLEAQSGTRLESP